jgi:prepilin-type N-terminal cleavage/methylation domain-containing protein
MNVLRTDARGFTLVELLVAAAIAGIGFLGLAATHATAIRATTVGRNTSIATTRASEEIEILRRLPYDGLASASAESVDVDGIHFSRAVAVSASPTGDSKRVAVTVDWTDQFGAHQVALVTVIAP